MHDATLDRTTNGAGLVSAATRDAIGRLRLKSLPRFGFQEATRTGAEVQVYLPGVDNLVERFTRAAAMGANLVSSDRPDLLMPLVISSSSGSSR